MELKPKQIVTELDRYIIGQNNAKRAVAVALRNRYRRRQLPADLQDEITPKNIIMRGPTGVGKTEIARRLAKLVKAPFVKVEATKFTEVGYVGRDVESMIRDLVECSIRLVKEEKIAIIEPKAKENAINKMLMALLPAWKSKYPETPEADLRAKLREDLSEGRLDNIPVELEIEEAPKQLNLGAMGGGQGDNNLGEFFGSIMPKRKRKRRITVKEAIRIFIVEEENRLLDNDAINLEGLHRAEQDGIVFIDEIDKICAKGKTGGGPDVSREGVQRDILPIVEGCTVSTKYGNIKTDYILFIAAGAFHISSVSDLIPELQGRFPVLVDLASLSEDDFYKILTEPDNALIMQYVEMLKVDNVHLKFTPDAIREMARIAFLENENYENIGARRLHNIMEMLLEEISFNADDSVDTDVLIDMDFVDKNLEKAIRKMNLKKYII